MRVVFGGRFGNVVVGAGLKLVPAGSLNCGVELGGFVDMKITDVKAWVVEPQMPAFGSTMDREWTFVRIDTDEGISGWGEATSSPRKGSFLTAQAVLAMKEALVGEDPGEYRAALAQAVPSVYIHGFSGIADNGDQWDRYCVVGHQGQGVGCADLRSAGR